MREKIAILINPKLHNGRIKNVLQHILQVLVQKDIVHEIFREQWPVDINIFKEVWIIGGDGTLNYFLNAYREIFIPIVLFKGGTGNDFSWKLYGDLSVTEQAHKVLEVAPKEVDAAECNGRIFINGVGVGFDGEVLRSINTVRRIGGHLGYLILVVKKIFSFKEHYFTIQSGGNSITGKFLLVIVANSSRTGGGFMVAPTADIQDGKLDMVLCQPMSIFRRLLNLPVIQNGKHLAKKYIIHQLVSGVIIESPTDLFAQLDGELINGNRFEITVTPKRFLFKF